MGGHIRDLISRVASGVKGVEPEGVVIFTTGATRVFVTAARYYVQFFFFNFNNFFDLEPHLHNFQFDRLFRRN